MIEETVAIFEKGIKFEIIRLLEILTNFPHQIN